MLLSVFVPEVGVCEGCCILIHIRITHRFRSFFSLFCLTNRIYDIYSITKQAPAKMEIHASILMWDPSTLAFPKMQARRKSIPRRNRAHRTMVVVAEASPTSLLKLAEKRSLLHPLQVQLPLLDLSRGVRVPLPPPSLLPNPTVHNTHTYTHEHIHKNKNKSYCWLKYKKME
jgi:hypothetical protein